MAKVTIKERKATLTARIVKERAHYHATVRAVTLEVRKNHPGLQWFEEAEMVESDPRVQVANATLIALCDAANIMGVEIY